MKAVQKPKLIEQRKIRDLLEQKIPKRVKILFKKIGLVADQMRFGVYLVGGLPRDLLLGEPNLDIDITVEGDGVALARELSRREGGLVKPHRKFQTAILALRGGFKIDVATVRREKYPSPGVLPEVEVSGSIREDLYRRDFTINSMAIQLNRGKYGRLIDYFGGWKDLKFQKIRVLHEKSFVDDPMRIIRAVRFEQRYGFSIEPDTETLLRKAVEENLLDKVTNERITKEINLILEEEDPFLGVQRLYELGVLDKLFPSIKIDSETKRLFQKIKVILREFNLTSKRGWVVYLIALMYSLTSEDKKQVEEKLVLHNKARRALQDFRKFGAKICDRFSGEERLKPSQIYFTLRGISTEALLFILAYSPENVGEKIRFYLKNLRNISLDISGNDLKRLGVPSGPMMGKILESVLAAKLNGKISSKKEELEFACNILSND